MTAVLAPGALHLRLEELGAERADNGRRADALIAEYEVCRPGPRADVLRVEIDARLERGRWLSHEISVLVSRRPVS